MDHLSQVLGICGPYMLAALAGVFCEIGGVVNIALEGILLVGGLAAVVATHWTRSPWIGVLAGMAAGIVAASLHALASLRYRVDQVVSGLAVNFLAAGFSRFVLKLVFHSSSNSARVEGLVPWGKIDPFLIVTGLLVLLSHFVLTRTSFGLRLRAVGERPHAAQSLGINVLRMRLKGILISGALAGLGGVWLALDQHQFIDGMSGGRGYIALAAVISGRWTPLGAAAAALFFGMAEASQIMLQARDIQIPTQIVQMVPYVITLIVVAGLLGRSRPPAADGVPFESEQDWDG